MQSGERVQTLVVVEVLCVVIVPGERKKSSKRDALAIFDAEFACPRYSHRVICTVFLFRNLLSEVARLEPRNDESVN